MALISGSPEACPKSQSADPDTLLVSEQVAAIRDHPKTPLSKVREPPLPISATTSLPPELTYVASEDLCPDDRLESILKDSCSGIMTKPGAGVSDRREIRVERLDTEETEAAPTVSNMLRPSSLVSM